MTLIALPPPLPAVKVGAVDFAVSAACLTDDGLKATVQAANGQFAAAETLLLTQPTDRLAVAERIAPLVHLEVLATADALLQLVPSIEAKLRELAADPYADLGLDWGRAARPVRSAPPPFPIEALRAPALLTVIPEAAAALNTPIDFLAATVLAVCSGAIGRRRRIHTVGHYFSSALLWMALVGEPGTAKSPPLDLAVKPLQVIQERYNAEYEHDRADYEADLLAWSTRPKQGRGARPEEPALRRILVSDTTIEALALILRANPTGLFLLRDELAGWLKSFNQYRAGGGSDRENWLSLYDGHAISIDRKTGTPPYVYVPHPFVAVCGGVQPSKLVAVLGRIGRYATLDDGLVDRLLLTFPDVQPGVPGEAPVQEEALAAYASLVQALTTLLPPPDGKPGLVSLAPTARTLWRQFHREHLDEQGNPTFPATLRGVWAKVPGHAARLTLIVHCLHAVSTDRPDDLVADDLSVAAGWTLADYFKAHARRVHDLRCTDPDQDRLDQIVAYIERKGGTITARDLVRSGAGGITTASAARAMFTMIEDHGLGRVEQRAVAGGTSVRITLAPAGQEEESDA